MRLEGAQPIFGCFACRQQPVEEPEPYGRSRVPQLSQRGPAFVEEVELRCPEPLLSVGQWAVLIIGLDADLDELRAVRPCPHSDHGVVAIPQRNQQWPVGY